MVKSYLRYEADAVFGLVSSSTANVCFDGSGRFLLAGGLERLLVWHARQGALLHSLSLPRQEGVDMDVDAAAPSVSAITVCPGMNSKAAVGYTDGMVAVWDIEQGVCDRKLAGRGSPVTALRYGGGGGSVLGCGTGSGEVVVWDEPGEVAICRLHGHRDQVTDLVFVTENMSVNTHVQNDPSVKAAAVAAAAAPTTATAAVSACAPNSPSSPQYIVTVSRDSQLRLWDLRTATCLQAMLLPSPLAAIDMHPSLPLLVAGGADKDLAVFDIAAAATAAAVAAAGEAGDAVGVTSAGGGGGGVTSLRLQERGRLPRAADERVVTLRFHGSGRLLLCQSAGKKTEVFRVHSDTEASKRAKHRRKRKRTRGKDKDKEKEAFAGAAHAGGPTEAEGVVEPADRFRSLTVIRTRHRARSAAFSEASTPSTAAASANSSSIQRQQAVLAIALHDNSVEIRSMSSTDDSGDTTLVSTLGAGGHRSAVRSLSLSSEGALLLSLSDGSAKVWTSATGACIATMDAGYSLCSLFVPGNQYAVGGTKGGSIDVFSVTAAERVAEVAAHKGALWAMAALPDGSGFVTGGADGNLKFWEYEMVAAHRPAPEESQPTLEGKTTLQLKEARSLSVGEDVLALSISPNGKYIAAALLDSTIKVYFADTLRFFLSMYGHKLPVLCCDISSDSTLLVSGSADKSVKIWGMDFGDCHRSMHAHSDSVTQVRFVPRTHYFFSTGKDRLLKYWDADKFQLLLVLPGHHAEVWALAVGPGGHSVFTGSHDRSIRRWQRTDEPFFVDEEREKRLEAMFESTPMVTRQERGVDDEDDMADGEAGIEGDEGQHQKQQQQQQQLTRGAVWAGDSLLEAVELAAATAAAEAGQQASDDDGMDTNNKPSTNPLLLGLSPSAYVLRAAVNVRSSELEDALLVLPFSAALKLLSFVQSWLRPKQLQQLQQAAGDVHLHLPPLEVELAARVVTAIVGAHHRQLVATPAARQTLLALQTVLQSSLKAAVAVVGCNLAALGHIKGLMSSQSASLDSSTDAAKRLREVRAQLLLPRDRRIAEKLRAKKMKKAEALRQKRQKAEEF